MLNNIRRWNDIDWTSVESKVFKWQREIYLASKVGDIRIVRKYQHCIIDSYEAKLLSVRIITEDNKKKLSIGIEDNNFFTSNEKIKLALSLLIPNLSNCFLKQVILKKRKFPKNSLSVNIIKDLCLQFLFKLALEPEWEPKFEYNSYYFRPVKSYQDAIVAIRRFIHNRPRYVLNGVISECFEFFNHEKLLNKIGMVGKYRRQLKYWLKCDILESNVVSYSMQQGELISYLFINIALHGIEDFCNHLIAETFFDDGCGKTVKFVYKKEDIAFIRCANSFVIMHSDIKVISLLKNKLSEFLIPIGLKLNSDKISITHTLQICDDINYNCSGFGLSSGFNFTGFFIIQRNAFHLSSSYNRKNFLRFRTLIVPSREKCKEYQRFLHMLILKYGKRMSQDELIEKLNPVIQSWVSDLVKYDTNIINILSQMDYLLFLKLRKWAKRIYKTIGKGKVVFQPSDNHKRTFATGRNVLLKHVDYYRSIRKSMKLKKTTSLFD